MLQPAWIAPRRDLYLAGVIAFGVLLVQGLWITLDQWLTTDATYHLLRGLRELTNARRADTSALPMNDPPLGGVLVSIPAWLMGWTIDPTRTGPTLRANYNVNFLYQQQTSLEILRLATATWKTMLMLPGFLAAFLWAGRLYGKWAAWLVLAALCFEPTIVAMTPVMSLDSLGLSSILLGAYLSYRYAQEPTLRRLVFAATAIAAALTIKHTAIPLPLFAVVVCLGTWIGMRRRSSEPNPWKKDALRWTGRLAAAAALTFVLIWPMTKFDISPPRAAMYPSYYTQQPKHQVWWELTGPEWTKTYLPAGQYIGSFMEGKKHSEIGHQAFFLGEYRATGWWYYFPVLATYKVPIGYGVFCLLGLLSLIWVRPRPGEWMVLFAFLLWSLLLLTTSINIGWRHGIVPEAFALLLASRCVTGEGRMAIVARVLAVLSLAAGISHVLYHAPNYIPYINYPREKIWTKISDSNLDWNHNVTQILRYADHNKEELAKPVLIVPFVSIKPFHRGRITRDATVREAPTIPEEGTMIISPTRLMGVYNPIEREAWAPLAQIEPDDIIDGSALVYDMARVNRLLGRSPTSTDSTTQPATRPTATTVPAAE